MLAVPAPTDGVIRMPPEVTVFTVPVANVNVFPLLMNRRLLGVMAAVCVWLESTSMLMPV